MYSEVDSERRAEVEALYAEVQSKLRGQKRYIIHELLDRFDEWVSLPRLMDVSRANRVSARIHDLRHSFGFIIDNRKEYGTNDRGDRITKSFYRLQ